MAIFGNISKSGSYYNEKNKCLYVNGWFLPTNEYDLIKINGKDAEMGINREDVHKNFNEYSANCGFEYSQSLQAFDGTIVVEVISKGKIVHSQKYTVPVIKYSLDENIRRKFILLGTDESNERFYYKYKERFEFAFFNNRDSEKNRFYDLEARNFIEVLQGDRSEEYLFVIGEKDKDYYGGILKNYGKREFNDYYLAVALESLLEKKQLILLHGNCHMTRIKSILSDTLKDEYFIYDVPLIYLNRKREIESDILSNIDVFIHQDIRSDNQYGYKLSDEYMVRHLKKTCIDICVPNLFGIGRAFFPQSIMGNSNNHIYRNGIGLFPYKDLIIEKCVEKQGEIIRLKNVLDEVNEIFSDDYIIENFNNYLRDLKKRESRCTVKLSEYLVNNYQTQRMFWDAGHPAGVVIVEICRQILNILQCDVSIEWLDEALEMDTYQTPVYEKVKQVLGLKWSDDEMRKNANNKLADVMDAEDYVKEYVHWCCSYK